MVVWQPFEVIKSSGRYRRYEYLYHISIQRLSDYHGVASAPLRTAWRGVKKAIVLPQPLGMDVGKCKAKFVFTRQHSPKSISPQTISKALDLLSFKGASFQRESTTHLTPAAT